MPPIRVLLPALALALSLTACKSPSRQDPPREPDDDRDARVEHRDEFEGRPVVRNYEAKAGDVTYCPYSGKKFEVTSESQRLLWREKSWVLCSDEPMDVIQANPEKYLEKYLEDHAESPRSW
jgi:hypothetical protein